MSAFAIYRLPHEDHATMIRQTKGEPVELHSITELNGKQGFVVAPFEVKDDQPVMLIEGEKTIVPLEATQFIMSSVPPSVMSSVPPSVMSSVSPSVMSSGVETSHGFMPIGEAKTSPTEIHEISPRASCVPSVASEQSSSALGRDDKPLTTYYKVDFANYHSQLKNDTFRKIVLARCADEKTDEKLDPMALFYKACAMYPRLFIALVETEKSGCWLTATPEILLDGKGSDWRTIALAGTMKLEDDQLNGEGETLTWSTKNIQEQRIVSTYITECLEQFTSNFSEEGPKTVRAANLVHLRSDFTFKLEDNNHIGDLLNTLQQEGVIADFGIQNEIGTNVEGKMVAALRRLGFDNVFDTDWGADLTIMEEATEFVDRFTNGGTLPLITSCSPGWVKYCEHYFPDMTENLSSCKSPHQMLGAVAKTYYAEKIGKKPEDIVVVSIMPCTAKKYECQRDDQAAAGVPDVDYVLTTRELARMIRRAGLKFTALPDEDFDDPLGLSAGAGDIFGATGGVMEAALRTAYCWLSGNNEEVVEFHEVRGTDGIKRSTVTIGETEIKVAVASGLANAGELLRRVQSGEEKVDFIEIMACPGGCVNGGGQPQQPMSIRNFEDLRTLRAKALYDEDKAKTLRLSHLNKDVQKLYDEFLEKPGSHKAHEILHTTYVKRTIN